MQKKKKKKPNKPTVDSWTMWELGVLIPCAVENLHITFDSPQLNYCWQETLPTTQKKKKKETLPTTQTVD